MDDLMEVAKKIAQKRKEENERLVSANKEFESLGNQISQILMSADYGDQLKTVSLKVSSAGSLDEIEKVIDDMSEQKNYSDATEMYKSIIGSSKGIIDKYDVEFDDVYDTLTSSRLEMPESTDVIFKKIAYSLKRYHKFR